MVEQGLGGVGHGKRSASECHSRRGFWRGGKMVLRSGAVRIVSDGVANQSPPLRGYKEHRRHLSIKSRYGCPQPKPHAKPLPDRRAKVLVHPVIGLPEHSADRRKRKRSLSLRYRHRLPKPAFSTQHQPVSQDFPDAHHRPDFREAQLVIRNPQLGRADEFGRIQPPAPGRRDENSSQSQSPSLGSIGILIQSTPPDKSGHPGGVEATHGAQPFPSSPPFGNHWTSGAGHWPSVVHRHG